MRNKWKVIVMCLVMAAVVLLEPVSYVRADDTTTEEGYNRTIGIPRLNASEVKFNKKSFFDWFGFKDIPEENCIEEFVVAHRKLENVDYALYDLVCDFELKTMGEGEAVTTSTYSYTINISEYEKGFFDSILVQFNLKEDYFEHVFSYFDIVRNADGFQKRDITGKEKYYTYNTVISQADFYFVRKSDGEKGEARRFTFTWDSDFWMQTCTKIDFSWYDHETEIEKEIGSVESETGVDGYSSNTMESYLGLDVSAWDEILAFFTGIPAAIVALVTGFLGFGNVLKELILVVFPFLPGGFVNILLLMFVFILLIGVCKFVQGLLG